MNTPSVIIGVSLSLRHQPWLGPWAVRTSAALTCIMLSTPASGNQSTSSPTPGLERFVPVPAPVRHAGTYHLATGTWTRNSSLLGWPSPVIYNNSCGLLVLMLMNPDQLWTDEGRVPSLLSPNSPYERKPGCASAYRIDGFDIAYCAETPTTSLQFEFRDRYDWCQDPSSWGNPVASFVVNGLPGGAQGSVACWTVSIDLESPPQSSDLTFMLQADGDGTWNMSTTINPNWFGVSVRMPTSAGSPSLDGLISTGDTCSGFGGTLWDPQGESFTPFGTGMDSRPGVHVSSPSHPPYCYSPDTLNAGFWLKLRSDTCPPRSGTGYCFGDGTGIACPCGNTGAPMHGCGHSAFHAGWLTAWGAPSVSADVVLLQASGLLSSATALYFQGTIQTGGGSGSTFGDGLLCAGGAIVRLGTKTSYAGTSLYPVAGDLPVSVRGGVPATGGVRNYQVWYRNTAAFCTPSGFNLTNGLSIVWQP